MGKMDNGEAPFFRFIARPLRPSKVLGLLDLTTNQLRAEDLRHAQAWGDVEKGERRAIVVGWLIAVAGYHGNFQAGLSGLAGHLDHVLQRCRNTTLQWPQAD